MGKDSHSQKDRIAVLFTETVPREIVNTVPTVIAPSPLQAQIEALGCRFVALDSLTEPGSVYEASAFLEELPKQPLDGTRITKACVYDGFELWWGHYDDLFNNFCLPYTRYKRLLEFMKECKKIDIWCPPHPALFYYYLRAHDQTVTIHGAKKYRLPLGIALQIILTVISLPVLALRRQPLMLFIGDKFQAGKDYDFRMEGIYLEVRRRQLRFMEFVRSLEPWYSVLRNAWRRRRPVVYATAITYLGRIWSVLSSKRRHLAYTRMTQYSAISGNSDVRFMFLIASHYLPSLSGDMVAIRITKLILRAIGIRAAFIPAGNCRNFQTVLACKLLEIPTVGIMHGVSMRHGTPGDFLPGFDGEKTLTTDAYGVWSEWWKEYYRRESDAYRPEQLIVSGTMRPALQTKTRRQEPPTTSKVLFVAEQTAIPSEVLPYLEELVRLKKIECTIKFRPYRDGFEEWLNAHRPDLLAPHVRVVKGAMEDAIAQNDIVVSCRSTGVLEALLQLKVPLFLNTKKWGDYFDLKKSDRTRQFLVERPEELREKIAFARSVPETLLCSLRERYFGDPRANGSAWVVDTLAQVAIP